MASYAMHMPCTCSCICHAHTRHMPCTCHAHTRHMPCTCLQVVREPDGLAPSLEQTEEARQPQQPQQLDLVRVGVGVRDGVRVGVGVRVGLGLGLQPQQLDHTQHAQHGCCCGEVSGALDALAFMLEALEGAPL